jgi:hypothetical protein
MVVVIKGYLLQLVISLHAVPNDFTPCYAAACDIDPNASFLLLSPDLDFKSRGRSDPCFWLLGRVETRL